MRKRLLSLAIVLALVMTLGMTVFATGSTTDPAVQASLDAYGKIKTAMENKDIEGLRAATEEFENCNFELSEEQDEELTAMIGDELFDVILTAGAVVGMDDAKDTFLADKNANTALFYADNYKLLVIDEEWGADTAALIKDMIPDGQAVYEDAKGYLPTENVMKVYNAYAEITFSLQIQSYDEDFLAAFEAFEEVLDIYNELTEEEMEQLAALMEEESGEEAFSVILSDWITANVVHEMGQLFDAYLENPNEDTANAFVEYYDSLYNDPDYVDEELRAVIEAFFGGIHDSYAEAKALADDEQEDDSTTGTESDKEAEPEEEEEVDITIEEERDASPKTGDAASVILPLTCMFAAAAVVVVTKRKKA